MPERERSRPSAIPRSPADPGEPEPDWAQEIRQRRRARGDRLRPIFEAFDDDDPSSPIPTRTPTRPPNEDGPAPADPEAEHRR